MLGAGNQYSVSSYGGEAEHTLTADEMPKHKHTASSSTNGSHRHQINTDKDAYMSTTNADWSVHGSTTGAEYTNGATTYNGDHIHTITVDNAGNDQAHNNMPPYYALCYIMKL